MCDVAPRITSWPRPQCVNRAMRLPMVPEATKSAASFPHRSADISSKRLTVGSSRYTSSPTSASAMARRMAGVGRVTVSLRRSTISVTIGHRPAAYSRGMIPRRGRPLKLYRGAAQLSRRLLNRRRDRWVAPAAADVSDQPVGDLVVRRRGVGAQESSGRHELARGAVAALGGDVADERLLERVQLPAPGEAFDRGHRSAVDFKREEVAGADHPAVHEHGARATDLGLAPALRAGEADPVPEEIEKHFFDWNVARPRHAIHRDIHARRLQRANTAFSFLHAASFRSWPRPARWRVAAERERW